MRGRGGRSGLSASRSRPNGGAVRDLAARDFPRHGGQRAAVRRSVRTPRAYAVMRPVVAHYVVYSAERSFLRNAIRLGRRVCLSEPPLPGPPGGGSERQTAACLLVRPGSGRVVAMTSSIISVVVCAMGPSPAWAETRRSAAGLGSAAGHLMHRCRLDPRTRARPRPLRAAGRPGRAGRGAAYIRILPVPIGTGHWTTGH